MKVDFQIIHNGNLETIKNNLFTLLKEVMQNFYFEIDLDDIQDNISIRYTYPINDNTTITGFALYFDDDNYSPDDMFKVLSSVDLFSKMLSSVVGIIAAFKYDDDIMYKELVKYDKALFEIEMKLREVLTFIFINTYKTDYYNLLQDYDLRLQKLHNKNAPDETYFRDNLENEFFFLLFSDYIKIDKTKDLQQIDLIRMLTAYDSYDELKSKLQNRGILDEKYKQFIAGVKENLNMLENLRNCVAHNRTISNAIRDNYEYAKEQINKIIKEFWETLEMTTI